jgi:hypothetical protein
VIKIRATVREGEGTDTSGTVRNVGFIVRQTKPTVENGYYICSYSITNRNNDLPRNRVIRISAELRLNINPFDGDNHDLMKALTRGLWYRASVSPPPSAYTRAVVGGTDLTLTNSAPRATVDFEVVYKPIEVVT